MKASRSSSMVWCLVPASGDTRRRSWGEYMVPPSLNVARMVAWESWHAALCMHMMWLLWCGQWPAMCVHKSGMPHSGHASVGANPYLCASLPFYSWPYRNMKMVMPSLGELRIYV